MTFEGFGSLDPGIDAGLKRGVIEIIQSPHAYMEKKTEAQRSLWERLFSLPWRPFERTKTIAVKEPAMFSYQNPRTGKLMFVCHPTLLEELRYGLKLSRFV